jgi:hypothetical protein
LNSSKSLSQDEGMLSVRRSMLAHPDE